MNLFDTFGIEMPEPVRKMTQEERMTMMIVGLIMHELKCSEVTITIPDRYVIEPDGFVRDIGTLAKHARQKCNILGSEITFKLIPPEIVIDAEIVEDTKLIEVKNAGD